MATLTVNRPDVFGPSQSVSVYPQDSFTPGSAPRAAAVASGTTDAAGALSITSGSILSLTGYVVAAQVNGVWVGLRARSTLDTFDTGRATGTGTTTQDSAALTSVSVTTGAFAIGQRIVGPGIPGGTFLTAGSGASWTMSTAATASGTGVALEGHGARAALTPPNTGVGALAVPQTSATPWRARLAQRRSIAGIN